MNMERQGMQECLLASLAALAGIPLATMREVGCRIAGVEQWSDFWTQPLAPHSFWDTINQLTTIFFPPTFKDLLYAARVKTPCPSGGFDFSGRGIVIVWVGRGTHALAYEHGVIYDPMKPDAPYPATQLDEGIIHRVIPLETSEHGKEERR